ncbi:MAG: VOC family protein [Sphingomicrobium sp.]|jgi:PhnB protein
MGKPIPEGYHTVTPYLSVKNAGEALDWYKRALGASEVMRFEHGGKVGHAEIRIGNSIVMLSDEWPEGGHLSPQSLGGTAVSLHIYVDDVDSAFRKAIDAGGKEERAVQDQFYGDRSGTLLDPYGHRWNLATHVEDVPEDELKRRMDQFMKSEAPAQPQPA